MLHARLLTIGTAHGLRHAQRIVRATFTAACFGMTTFWVWHNYSDSIPKFLISNLRSRFRRTVYFELCTLMCASMTHFKAQSTKNKKSDTIVISVSLRPSVESSVFLSAVNPHSCEMKLQRKYHSRIANPLAFPTANRSALMRSHNCRRSSPRRKWDKALCTFRRKAHDPAARE